MQVTEDKKFMKIALKLSRRGSGFTEPNPLVGAVVVKDNKIISTGYHRSYGSEHAEVMALKNVKEKATTLYITLEPCSHFGKTAPCTDLIIKKKVKRVVISVVDPNPLVNGRGVKKLEENGISTEVGLFKDISKKINRHYFKFKRKKLPYVTLKAGVSIDGKMTDKNKKSEWITDKQLRRFSHSLRGEFSAILVGVNTIVCDDPLLTLREKEWKGKKLKRIVLDSNNKLNSKHRIFKNQNNFPLIIFSSNEAGNKRINVENHFFVNSDKDGLDLKEILKKLYKMGISSVLVEGGGSIIDSFLRKRLYDETIFFTADKLIGGKESVELFSSGTSLLKPVVLKNREIIELKTGHIVRGFK